MRILLDANIHVRLRFELPEHEVVTVRYRGWAERRNGELLTLADREFDVFVTGDAGMQVERNLAGLTRLGRLSSLRRTTGWRRCGG